MAHASCSRAQSRSNVVRSVVRPASQNNVVGDVPVSGGNSTVSPSSHDAARRVQRVAQMLLADGYMRFEVDAVLAAVQLIAAAEQSEGSASRRRRAWEEAPRPRLDRRNEANHNPQASRSSRSICGPPARRWDACPLAVRAAFHHPRGAGTVTGRQRSRARFVLDSPRDLSGFPRRSATTT